MQVGKSEAWRCCSPSSFRAPWERSASRCRGGSPSQQNLVIERHASGARCTASEGGSLCSPLWMGPWLVLAWYGDRVRRALR